MNGEHTATTNDGVELFMKPQDMFITLDEKKLFVRIWTPKDENGKAPIILFHDSLGSVELWRDFPEVLSNATQRQVIAYDRFGYGKSSAKPKAQPIDFISQEAEIYFPALLTPLNIEKFVGLVVEILRGFHYLVKSAKFDQLLDFPNLRDLKYP